MATQSFRQLNVEHTVLLGNAKGCWLKLIASHGLDRNGGTTPSCRDTERELSLTARVASSHHAGFSTERP